MKKLHRIATGALAALMAAGLAGCAGADDGTVNLTFQIWDVAVLPACPDPASGGGRATISNGLCYAASPKNKNLEIVKDVLRFFGSEEGQRIQGESGAAIPAALISSFYEEKEIPRSFRISAISSRSSM